MATDLSRLLAAAVALGVLAPASGRADEARPAAPAATGEPRPAEPAPAAEAAPPAKPTRRGGFMVGVDLGAGVGSIVGYPNDLTKIGLLSAYTVTGARPAGMIEGWIGGAFTDWFNFGLGFTTTALSGTGDDKARILGGMFRIEAFPLFPLGGRWRDLGVRFDAGLAFGSVTDPTGFKLVDSSSASLVGGGVFWEGLRAWKTAHGPMLVGTYVWSDTARCPAILLGWRSVLYTSP